MISLTVEVANITMQCIDWHAYQWYHSQKLRVLGTVCLERCFIVCWRGGYCSGTFPSEQGLEGSLLIRYVEVTDLKFLRIESPNY